MPSMRLFGFCSHGRFSMPAKIFSKARKAAIHKGELLRPSFRLRGNAKPKGRRGTATGNNKTKSTRGDIIPTSALTAYRCDIYFTQKGEKVLQMSYAFFENEMFSAEKEVCTLSATLYLFYYFSRITITRPTFNTPFRR